MKKNSSNKHKFFYCYTLISIIFLLFIISCGSVSLNNNVPVDVYVGGESFISTTNVPVAVYWKNGEMIPLSTKYWKENEKKPQYTIEMSRVSSIFVSSNEVYAGGYYKAYDLSHMNPYSVSMDDYAINVACYWKNGKLVSLTYSKYGSEVNSIFVSGNDVYAGGYIHGKDAALGGYWKNGKWVGLSNAKYGSMVRSIFVSSNDVYVSGWISNSNGIVIPCYWKNGEMFALSFISEKKTASAYSIFVSSNDVYVCGYSRNNLGVDTACYWKNGELIPLLPFDSKYNSIGASIFVSRNDVYVGGYIKNSYRFPTVAGYWKNGKWVELPSIVNESISKVTSIFVFGNDVYVGGYSNEMPGYWKNDEWVGLSNSKRGEVSSIIVVPRPTGQ